MIERSGEVPQIRIGLFVRLAFRLRRRLSAGVAFETFGRVRIFAVFGCLFYITACASLEKPSTRNASHDATPNEMVQTTRVLLSDARFADTINDFIMQDQATPPTPCRTVFVGSSSIRLWSTLSTDFPDLNALNRGFGGSQISHINEYFSLIFPPHQPKEIIFYAGENDINSGLGTLEVVSRFEAFMETKSQYFNDTPVYFISIKPSIRRIEQLDEQRKTNALIARLAEEREDLVYVDTASKMLFDDDRPKPVFTSDQLHMNSSGYRIWADELSVYLADQNRPVRSGC